MKLIYVTPFLRVPPDFGAAIRNFQLLKYLSEHHHVTVISYGENEAQTDAWLTERGMRSLRLPIAVAWGGTGRRGELRNLLYYPPSFFQRFAPHQLFDALRAESERVHGADVVVCDTALTGQVTLYGKLEPPVVTVLLDLYQQVQRQQLGAMEPRPYRALAWANLLKTRSYENRVLGRQRYLVTVSLSDDDFVRRHFPRALTHCASNGVDTTAFAPNWEGHRGKELLFVGGFEYAPNEDAFFYFCREILPRIRAQDRDARFKVVGRAPTAAMKKFAENEPAVDLVGAVEQVNRFYAAASVVVVPLRFGGGIKLKTLEAFAAGAPVVATRIGVEGIAAQDGVHVRIADDAEAFATQTLGILASPEASMAMARRARDLVCARYDWRAIAREFEGFLEHVAADAKAGGQV